MAVYSNMMWNLVALKKVKNPYLVLYISELAVHDVVKVKVTSNEDIWAVKVINLLSSIQSLLHGSPIAREVPIFGAHFDEDVFVVGLIDELK